VMIETALRAKAAITHATLKRLILITCMCKHVTVECLFLIEFFSTNMTLE
jgi:hypothetical protein